MKTKFFLLCMLLICLLPLNQAFAFQEPARAMLPNFDRRLPPQPLALDPQRQAAVDQLKSRIPALRVDLDDVLASPKWILNPAGFLSGPDFTDAPPLPPIPGRQPQRLLVVQATQRDP